MLQRRTTTFEGRPLFVPVVPCLATLLLLLAGCSSTAQLQSIESQLAEVQRQLLQIQRQTPSKDTVQELGGVVSEEVRKVLRSGADMQVELRQLATQIEQLRARLEDTHVSLEQLSLRIAATHQELQSLRVASLLTPGEETTSPILSPTQLYNGSYQDYQTGKYALAIQGFRQYLASYPDTELADNALYWIGECYFAQGQYRQAIQEFSDLQARYPTSDKLPGAGYKKGFAFLELGNRAQGIVWLQRVIEDYPNHDNAVLARKQLKDLGIGVDGQ